MLDTLKQQSVDVNKIVLVSRGTLETKFEGSDRISAILTSVYGSARFEER